MFFLCARQRQTKQTVITSLRVPTCREGIAERALFFFKFPFTVASCWESSRIVVVSCVLRKSWTLVLRVAAYRYFRFLLDWCDVSLNSAISEQPVEVCMWRMRCQIYPHGSAVGGLAVKCLRFKHPISRMCFRVRSWGKVLDKQIFHLQETEPTSLNTSSKHDAACSMHQCQQYPNACFHDSRCTGHVYIIFLV